MDLEAEDPRCKANAFRVPLYASQYWQKMYDLGTYTIKDMIREMADRGESDLPTQTVFKSKRNRNICCAKSKATVDSDNAESDYNKSARGKGVESFS